MDVKEFIFNTITKEHFHSPYKPITVGRTLKKDNHIMLSEIITDNKPLSSLIAKYEAEKYELPIDYEQWFEDLLCALFLLENEICSIGRVTDTGFKYYSQVTRKPSQLGIDSQITDWALNYDIKAQLEKRELRAVVINGSRNCKKAISIDFAEMVLSPMQIIFDIKNILYKAVKEDILAIKYRGLYYESHVSSEIMRNCAGYDEVCSLSISPEIYLPIINGNGKIYSKSFNILEIEDVYPT